MNTVSAKVIHKLTGICLALFFAGCADLHPRSHTAPHTPEPVDTAKRKAEQGNSLQAMLLYHFYAAHSLRSDDAWCWLLSAAFGHNLNEPQIASTRDNAAQALGVDIVIAEQLLEQLVRGSSTPAREKLKLIEQIGAISNHVRSGEAPSMSLFRAKLGG